MRFFVPIASGLRMTKGEGLRMTEEGTEIATGLMPLAMTVEREIATPRLHRDSE